jgi:hypothetical protein
MVTTSGQHVISDQMSQQYFNKTSFTDSSPLSFQMEHDLIITHSILANRNNNCKYASQDSVKTLMNLFCEVKCFI